MDSDSDDSSLGSDLEDEFLGVLIVNEFEKSTFDRHEFLPHDRIDKLITRPSVAHALNMDLTRNLASGDERLLNFILQSAKRVFAIILTCHFRGTDLRRVMTMFRRKNFEDNALPVTNGVLAELDCFNKRPWSPMERRLFFREQWAFLAPVFSSDNFKMDLEPDHILPFILVDKDTISGSFSQVFHATIHPAHWTNPVLTDDGRRADVAIEEIKDLQYDNELEREKAKKDWEDEARYLGMIRVLNHPNIVPSIATIRRGGKRYFVSQWADGGSLQDLWKSMPSPNLNADLVREVLQQLRGLARALVELQKFKNGKPHCLRPGCLKPESILRFRNGASTVVGTLKIAAMGLEQHPNVAVYRGLLTPPQTSALHSTVSYAPPEAFNEELAAEAISNLGDLFSPNISRLHDISGLYEEVWSMGCVILEFLVWILYGYDELTRFHEKIRGPMGEARPFFVVEQESGHQVAKLCSIVTDYMDHISKDPECDGRTGLGHLFRYTREYFLVVSLAARATIPNCCNMLNKIVEIGEKDQRYWFTGSKRDGIRGPTSVDLLRNSSFLSPESAQQRRPSTDAGSSIPSVAIITKAPSSAVFDLAPANPTEGPNEGLPIHVAPPQTSTTEGVDEKDQLTTPGKDESSTDSNRPPEAGSSGTSASFGTTETSSLEDSTLFSDEEIGDNSPLEEYDLDGEEPELRISDPETYFENLSCLREEIEGHSCWWIHSGQTNISPEDTFAHLCDSKATESMNSIKKSDIWDSTEERWTMAESVSRMLKLQKTTAITAEINEELILLECLEVLRRSYANVLRLQRAGFCGEYITVAAQDWMRPQVVRLSRVFIDSICQLCCDFRRTPSMLVSRDAGKEVVITKASFEERYKSVNEGCRSIISEMGLPLQPPRGPLQQMAEWQATVQAIDLAIVSYAGTHIRPFTREAKFQADKDQEYLQLPVQFASYHSAIYLPKVSQIFLRRRRLLCLDAFLGGREIWVFQRSDDMSNQGMYLSTGLEELTDLWGPSWRLFRNAEPDHIQSIEIGNGCIIPWSTSRATDEVTVVPDTTGSEVYCHWVFSLDWNSDEVERCQQELDRKYFLDSDTFLIGVPDGLRVNPDCNPSREEMIWKKTRLEESEALHPPNTSYSRRYKDSHSIAFTANIPIAGSHAQSWTYKRQEGMLWKSALVERWRNKRGVPGELENFSGLEISLCTQNARRVRLLSLLGSDTMRHYLHSLSFSWPPGFFWETYFEAFQSVNQFRVFWNKHNKLPAIDKIKEAIAESLEILQGTGVNNFSWELGALWVAVFENEELPDDSNSDTYSDSESRESSSREVHSGNADSEPKEGPMPYKKVEDMIVSLFRSEYTWTPFLMDSPKIITMAIITTSCLEATDDSKWGRRCQRGWREGGKFVKVPGYPVLATSLFVNESILESKQLVSKKRRGLSCRKWDTRGLCTTAKFSLGDHGELEVLTTPTRNCPVTTMEWQGVIGLKESWNEIKDASINEEFFGRSRTPHHKEHISGEWETLPLPILIISKASKPLLLK